ncbi:MAG: T9SS type A sorting domain-containing protein, partial [Prolixibacteraceae bacterium]
QMEKLETYVVLKSEGGIAVWPNPFDSELFLHSSQTSESCFSICNSTGKLIKEFLLQANEQKRINTKRWQSGLYFLRYRSQNNQCIYKIVKI